MTTERTALSGQFTRVPRTRFRSIEFTRLGGPLTPVQLAIGVLFSSIAPVPWTLLIAAHRPDVLGKLPLVEVSLYFAFPYFAIRYFGLEGAAITWTSRMKLIVVRRT